jgi:glycosyltransferase involved in cell wall biosynthesis
VQFVGWRPDVERWLAAADGLVLSSRWEGMPNAVLEAMAAGKPVVATDVEGVSELVRPGQTGWLVPVENVTALADGLADFAAQPERRRQFGAAAQKLVQSEYSYDRMVARYESLWREKLRRA